MILKSTSKIAFSLWQFDIHWYGIIMTISIIIAALLAYKLLKEEKDINFDDYSDFVIWLIISGIVGARLYYVFFNIDYYSNHLIEIIQIYKGGLSIHGCILGGALGYFLHNKIFGRFKGSLDIIAIVLPLAQAIGRWGNFFNNEAYGCPTNWSLKLFIPQYLRPAQYINNEYFHPTFLYESVLNLGIFIILYFLYKNHKNKLAGLFPYLYLILYSIVRFIIEPIRIDSIYYILGLPLAQFISIAVFIFATSMIVYKIKKTSY